MLGSQNVASQADDLTAIRAVTDVIPNAGAMTDLGLVRMVTDVLPDAGALTSISSETDKIDQAATDGLTGTDDSVAYRANEVERHLHSYDHWFGLAAAPIGETHRADHGTMTPFVSTAGNDTWGGWLQILGSTDTPHIAGMTAFDLSVILISDLANIASLDLHLIQIGYGASGAAALSADTVTEIMALPEKGGKTDPIIFRTRRCDAGTKVWIRHWVDGTNMPTLSVFHNFHEYEG